MALEVTGELDAAGIPSLVLKGASLAQWLFPAGEPRPYTDCDILVSPAQLATAGEVLDSVGFRYVQENDPGSGIRYRHDQSWMREDGLLELHMRIPGIGLAPLRAWELLSAGSVPLDLAGGTVPVLAEEARGLHLVLHAVQHGRAGTDRDLTRALALFSPERWDDIAALARRLKAEEGLGLGLRARPEGAPIADRLGLPDRVQS